MSTMTYDSKLTSVIPPTRIFKAIILDDGLVPRIMPEAIQSIEKLKGDGEPGTIKLVTYRSESQVRSATQRVDEVDEANHTYKYSVIDGDALFRILEFISYNIKIEDGPDGGSVCKITSMYQTKTKDHDITKEKIKAGKDKSEHMFKVLEEYLIEHPDEYNITRFNMLT